MVERRSSNFLSTGSLELKYLMSSTCIPMYIGGSPEIRVPINKHGLVLDELRPIDVRWLDNIVNHNFGACLKP
jgi:hypothetical protein